MTTLPRRTNRHYDNANDELVGVCREAVEYIEHTDEIHRGGGPMSEGLRDFIVRIEKVVTKVKAVVQERPSEGAHDHLVAALEGLMWRFADDDADPHDRAEVAPDIQAARDALAKDKRDAR